MPENALQLLLLLLIAARMNTLGDRWKDQDKMRQEKYLNWA